uniref:UNC93-like protein n=1 Tax=Bombyx mori TaxID=7091 RepID=A0A8R2LWL9_BOMMO|nr:UNC93-like protein isoform X5 [Bombyx mori]
MAEEVNSKREVQVHGTGRIVKNVLVISLAFMTQFTAYSGAANLQSSINASAGLGTAALAAVYAGLILSNIFLPVFVIKWLGTKWTISFSFLTYMPYIAAQLYPRFYTMIPAGLLVGLGGGPLWCAKCTYLYVMSEAHSAISKITAEALLVRFLGIFFMIFHTSQIWGNLISSLGIYLACMAGAAIIVAVGVDPMKKFDTRGSGSGTGLSGLALLAATLKLLIEPNQILMIPINVFLGFQQAFFGADFTAAFVSCAVGTGSVGFVMMTYGLADAIGCIVNGYIAKRTIAFCFLEEKRQLSQTSGYGSRSVIL